MKAAAEIAHAKAVLWQKDIKFGTANNDMHFMISHNCTRIDFWPTSGKWVVHGFRDVAGRGLDKLLTYMETFS